MPACRILSFFIKKTSTRKVRGMKTLGIIGIVIVALVGLWMWKYPSGTWRYKMTLTVQTPEGMKTGSAVREVHVATGPELPQATAVVRVKGEAIVVDMGRGGLLFGLLRSQTSVDGASYVFFDNFPIPGSRGSGDSSTTSEGVRYYNQLKSGKAEIAARDLPMLVRFKDINDPKTVERVDPNNLAATFGEGVKLVSATIEITDEPTTTGIEKVLPSWKGTDFAKWRASLPYGHPLAIDRSDFIKGASK